jgi:hypothetical protein
MRSDSEINRDVESELRWDPDIQSDAIAVPVKEGTVSLIGFVQAPPPPLRASAVRTPANGGGKNTLFSLELGRQSVRTRKLRTTWSRH